MATLPVLALGCGAAIADAPGGSTAFQVRASHGYTLRVLAGSRRADGSGNVVVWVYKRGSAVTYAAPAIVTAERIEANLGPVGRIDLHYVSLAGTTVERSACGARPLRFPAGVYKGDVEFHGMESFADASATRVRPRPKLIADLVCVGSTGGEEGGPGLPGARLTVRRKRAGSVLALQINKNHPQARARYSAELQERRGALTVVRQVYGAMPARAFPYSPSLHGATLAPLAPFAGAAGFHALAPRRNRWTGDLSLDFPGRSGVRLAGAGTTARLAPARQFGQVLRR